ncbi:MAG: long-chain fatty acid--CoA ligase [Candidatus Aminicenantaceae bacterium]
MVETIGQLFLNTVKSYPKDALLLYKKEGEYTHLSTAEFEAWVKDLSLGLQSLGLKKGDKLIIFLENSPFWVMTDLATLCLGGITVPIYTSLMPEQVKYIIDNSDARIVVCSGSDLWAKVAAVRHQLDKVEHFISLGGDAPTGTLTLMEVQERGRELGRENPELFEQSVAALQPDDIASIIYTSGTTGLPKGVMLMHGNFMSNIKAIDEILEFSPADTTLSFLPLSHVLERMVSFTYLYNGCTIGYAESVETLGANLLEIRPTIMVNVPRILEKIYAKVIDNVLTSSPLKRKIFYWALNVGKEVSKLKLQNQPLPGGLKFKHNIAHKLVFSKIIAKTGGRVRFFVSGGGPLSKDIAEFFHAVGILILEGYGLTETSPVISVNTFDHLKFGAVGPPIPGVEVKIAEDGEILTKGPHVMKGYYKMEEVTREAIRDGWFYTGDIGLFDENGYLVITDRKKDIIVTAGGKNVAPQPIENILKLDPFIEGALLVGDRRKFISALIVPSFEKLEEYAKSNSIAYDSRQDLVTKETIIQFYEKLIDRITPNLASYEKIKKVILMGRDFEIEKGEMTPSLKVKRNIVEEKYTSEINSLYQE